MSPGVFCGPRYILKSDPVRNQYKFVMGMVQTSYDIVHQIQYELVLCALPMPNTAYYPLFLKESPDIPLSFPLNK